MKLFIVALFVAAAAANAVDESATILKNDYQLSPEGNYVYAYENDNQIAGQASGSLKVISKDEAVIIESGSFQYKSPEGELVKVTYTADENGFHPEGAHLPTPPAPQPIPDYILRSLEYIAAHPPQVEKKL